MKVNDTLTGDVKEGWVSGENEGGANFVLTQSSDCGKRRLPITPIAE